MTSKHMVRIDKELMSRGLVTSRTQAQRLIDQRRVFIGSTLVTKASTPVDTTTDITINGDPFDDYVGRGAYKLEAALAHTRPLGFDPNGRICLDAGASTGGFTDILLRNGAALVYAVDVGHDQLDPRIRANDRVIVKDRTNIRHITAADFDEPPSFIVGDLSFISLTLLINPLVDVSHDDAQFILLIKPQFEVENVGKNGIVRSSGDHFKALLTVAAKARAAGLIIDAAIPSPIKGHYGNQEFFLAMHRAPSSEQGNVEQGELSRDDIDMLHRCIDSVDQRRKR